MRNCRALSSNDLDSQCKTKHMSPHPPNEPFQGKNEAIVKIRQRRYRHQSSEQSEVYSRIDDRNLDVREIRSAGSNSFGKVENLQSDVNSIKTKISSAPSPRTRASDYRTCVFKRENSERLYTFQSIPSLIQDKNDVLTLPRTKRKEQNCSVSSIPTVDLTTEPDLPPITISKAIIPCVSQASPVPSDYHRSLILVKRQSLQQISKMRWSQLSKRSFQKSDLQTNSDINSSIHLLSSLEFIGHEPINLNQYRSPDDVSDSFEANMLASLVAERAKVENANNFSLSSFPKLLNSKNFSAMVTPRTAALIGGSYSDEESSATTTGPLTNRLGVASINHLGVTDPNGMHNEWKRCFNQSQDTYRSVDVISATTDSYCQSVATDDNSVCGSDGTGPVSGREGYIAVHYIPELDCYIEPNTGVWYESNL